MGSERNKGIPWEIVHSDGSISRYPKHALNRYSTDYEKLYNPDVSSSREYPIIGENIYPENIVDTGINETIKMDEIIRVLHKSKDVKSHGYTSGGAEKSNC